MPEVQVAIERRSDGTPVDPEIAQAEREGRVIYGRPVITVPNELTSEVHQLQQVSEGVKPTGATVDFCDEKFVMAEKIGLMPLLKFAHISNLGVKADDMAGLDAMYMLIKNCIADEEWERFEKVAVDKHADENDLLDVVTNVIEALSARPSQRRSASSAGSPQTPANSKVSSIRPAPEGLTPLQ